MANSAEGPRRDGRSDTAQSHRASPPRSGRIVSRRSGALAKPEVCGELTARAGNGDSEKGNASVLLYTDVDYCCGSGGNDCRVAGLPRLGNVLCSRPDANIGGNTMRLLHVTLAGGI
jgi:hypothetical protein